MKTTLKNILSLIILSLLSNILIAQKQVGYININQENFINQYFAFDSNNNLFTVQSDTSGKTFLNKYLKISNTSYSFANTLVNFGDLSIIDKFIVSVDIDKDGYLYLQRVGLAGLPQILKYNASGVLLDSTLNSRSEAKDSIFNTTYTSNTKLRHDFHSITNTGNLIVSFSYKQLYLIKHSKFDGSLIGRWNHNCLVYGLGVDNNDNVYIVDSLHFITKYSSTGKFISKTKINLKRIREQVFLSFDSNGNLYLTNDGVLLIYDSNLKLKNGFESFNGFDLYRDKINNGYIYTGDNGIYELFSNDTISCNLNYSYKLQDPPKNKDLFFYTNALISKNGTKYIFETSIENPSTDTIGYTYIHKYKPDGSFIKTFKVFDDYAANVAIDQNENLYFTSAFNNDLVIVQNGSYPLCRYYYLTSVDSSGNLLSKKTIEGAEGGIINNVEGSVFYHSAVPRVIINNVEGYAFITSVSPSVIYNLEKGNLTFYDSTTRHKNLIGIDKYKRFIFSSFDSIKVYLSDGTLANVFNLPEVTAQLNNNNKHINNFLFATDTSGNIYFLDRDKYLIYVYNTNGKLLCKWSVLNDIKIKSTITLFDVGINGEIILGYYDYQSSSTTLQVYNSLIKTGIEDDYLASSITVFPNPASNQLNVSFNQAIRGSVSLVNLQGEEIQEQEIEGNALSLSTENIPNGVYILKVITDKGTASKQVVILK